MNVKVEENGRRSVQVEVEVPGSPELVWQAIASGPGISSWFVPTEVEQREGGAFKANFGPGMESESTISQWDPPRRFTKDGDGMDPEAPPVATEWIVEAKSGGTCVVRVVHSWFASTDEWDGQWEMVETGWMDFFNILRLKLERFPGQSGAAFSADAVSGLSESEMWAALTLPLGLLDAVEGQEPHPVAGVPALSGKVVVPDRIGVKQVMLLIREPGPGVFGIFASPMGDQHYVSIRFYLFGKNAAALAAKAEPEWSRWLAERLPAEAAEATR